MTDTDVMNTEPRRYVFQSEYADIHGIYRISNHYFILTSSGIYVVSVETTNAVIDDDAGRDLTSSLSPTISFQWGEGMEYIPYRHATYIQYHRASDTLDIVYERYTRAVSVETSYIETADGRRILKEYRPSYDIYAPFANRVYQFMRVWNNRGIYVTVYDHKKQVVIRECDDPEQMRIYYIDPEIDYDRHTNFVWCEDYQAILGVFHITVKARSGWCVFLFLEHIATPVMADFIFTLDYPMTSPPWVSLESDDRLYVFCVNKHVAEDTTDVVENGIDLTSFLNACVRMYGIGEPTFPKRVRIEDDADLVHLSMRDIVGRVRTIPAKVEFRFLKPPASRSEPVAIRSEPVAIRSEPVATPEEVRVQSSSYIDYLKWIVDNYDDFRGNGEYILFYDKDTYTIPIYNSNSAITVNFQKFYGKDTTEPMNYVFQKMSLTTGYIYERVYEYSTTTPYRIIEKYVIGTSIVSNLKRTRLNRIIVALGYPIARDHYVYHTPYMYFRFRADVLYCRPKSYWERAYCLLNSAEGVELIPWLFLNLCSP